MSPTGNKFVFDPQAASDNVYVKEWRDELQKIEDLIADLCDRVKLAEQFPFFSQIIKFLPEGTTPAEIKVLGKALVKYAELQPRQKELRENLAAIDLAKKNPDIFAMAFHDTSDIATQFETLLQTETK